MWISMNAQVQMDFIINRFPNQTNAVTEHYWRFELITRVIPRTYHIYLLDSIDSIDFLPFASHLGITQSLVLRLNIRQQQQKCEKFV